MSHNSFGHLFRVTTWGESHGLALGCVVDGCPPGITFTEAEIQAYLDKRKPGQSKYTTQRREPDQVRVLSGVLLGDDGVTMTTTGTPISMMIENTDQRSKDYGEIARQYRPGHADYTYDVKYGIRDYRGGGRSSARETAARVAAGAIARKIVPGLEVKGALVAMGVWYRPPPLELVRSGQQSFLLAGCRFGRAVCGLSRWYPQERIVGWRGHRDRC